MILRGSFTNLVSPLGGEFQMVGLLGMSENDAIETVVVFKLRKYHEVQTLGIHLGYGGQMVSGSSDTEYSASFHH